MCGIGASHLSLPRIPYIPSREKHKKTSTRPFAPRPLLAMGRSTDDARSILLSRKADVKKFESYN